jgi:peptide/nickel transport system permease protein
MVINAERAEVAAEPTEDIGVKSARSRVLTELLHDGGALAGMGFLALLVVLTLIAPLIARHNPDIINVLALNQGPSANHWFGTDYLGRDLWARVLYGGRVSLPAGLGVVLVASGVGVPLGLLAGYIGGLVDDVFMRLMDILLAFPGIVLAVGVIAILGAGLNSAILAIGITSIPFFARFARGSTLATKEEAYVAAAHVVGTPHRRIVRRHILPNVAGPLIVLGAATFGYAILATAALSYLGLGTQPPTSDWGVLMSQGYDHMFEAASEVIFPGLAIVLTVLGANLLADGLTDAFNARA